jgi:hypothetical protein
MDEPKIPLHKDSESISKLTKAPVPVKVGLYELAEDGESLIKKEEVDAFLHRLNWLERNHVRAANTEVYKFHLANGGDKDTAREAVINIIPRMTVYFSLKIGESPKSPKFFETQEILMAYPYEEGLWALYRKYLEEFELSETEWGNLFRARNLGTLSALPAISPVPTPSEQPLHN